MSDDGGFVVRIVDDDEAVRDSLEALLVVSGFEVETFDSAESYLAEAGGGGCLLLDVHMPGIGGLGLMQELAGRGRLVPVVILTASRDPWIRDQALALGARGVLTKPVPQGELIAALRAVGDGQGFYG
jgi:FixJ family two-component response regulator